MGWRAVYKDTLRIVNEDDPGQGRPVDDGNEGKLCLIAQEDYHHKIVVDLINGVIGIDYEDLTIEDVIEEGKEPSKRINISNVRSMLWICEETSFVGEMKHRKTIFHSKKEKGKVVRDEAGKPILLRTDHETPIIFRPIWFTRNILVPGAAPVKVIGAQATTPEGYGGRNVKKMISIFSDGRLGVD